MTPLRQRMIEDMRIRNFTEKTQTSYCQHVSQFARYFHRSYRVTLKKDWPIETIIPTPKRETRLPVVLSPDEVRRLLDAVTIYKHRVILTTCYPAGLRISEVICLTPLAIDSERLTVRVEQGKGRQDRYVMLSPTLLQLLREWWRAERVT